MNRTIRMIDKEIDAIHTQLRSLETIDRLSAESWQAAWDKHPDLRAQETALFRERGDRQELESLRATVKIGPKSISLNGMRVSVRYFTGPWISGVRADLIKIRRSPIRGNQRFPVEFSKLFTVENSSDPMTDYFEADTIRICSEHPLYNDVKRAAA